MIFVTVGTHHQPFDRLISALDSLQGSDLVVQYGHSKPPARAAESAAFMPFDVLRERMSEADIVITHAGVGSILVARSIGHVPVAVPRRADADEHVDDHQAELTRALAGIGVVTPVWDVSQLPHAVASTPAPGEKCRPDPAELVTAIRDGLYGIEGEAAPSSSS